jgi:dCMP deaminase
MALNKWDLRYLTLARQISAWSKDPSTKVGAVIADKRGRAVALGFNGFPEKVIDAQHKYENKDTKYEMTVHAEVNAALIAGLSAAGGTIYVYGAPICPRCAGVLIQADIARAVARTPKCTLSDSSSSPCKNGGINWDELGRIALEMFDEAKIDFDPIGDSDEREISKWVECQISK